MAIDDRPSDIQQTSPAYGAGNNIREGRGISPSLSEQTPGMDRASRARNMAMRPVSYARERPAIALSILGGLVVLGLGTWLALRSRKPTRWEMLRDYGVGLGVGLKHRGAGAYDWMRSRF
jgi:hypothetical protein